MSCVVFNTEVEANAYQAQAYADWIAIHSDHPYVDHTRAWAQPAQRITDQRWFLPLCPVSDNTGQDVQEYDPSWEPPPEPYPFSGESA